MIALIKREFAAGMDFVLASRVCQPGHLLLFCHSTRSRWGALQAVGWRHSTYPLARTALFSEPVAAASRTAVGAFTEIRATGGIWVVRKGKRM